MNIYGWFRRKRFFAILFISFVLLLFYSTDAVGRLLYPIKYQSDIQKVSKAYDIDPYFVASIIRVESRYKPDKVSAKGAVGLMQLMPNTAKSILTSDELDNWDVNQLGEPTFNIELGARYLQTLTKQFHVQLSKSSKEDEIAFIAAAYNAGPGNVSNWLADGLWDGKYSTMKYIPIGETRHYIERVMYYYKKYERYYDEL